MVEADTLLKREVETLAEAMETANNAVFFALWTISVMISVSLVPVDHHLEFWQLLLIILFISDCQESFPKYRSSTDLQMREVKSTEVVKVGHHPFTIYFRNFFHPLSTCSL